MSLKIPSPQYYKEYLDETRKTICEKEQSKIASQIVREIEIQRGGKEEEERRTVSSKIIYEKKGFQEMNREDRQWENKIREEHEEIYGLVDKVPMEDKLVAALEEYPTVQELTPGEIAQIVNTVLQELPEELIEESGPEIAEACSNVAYEVMSRLTS